MCDFGLILVIFGGDLVVMESAGARNRRWVIDRSQFFRWELGNGRNCRHLDCWVDAIRLECRCWAHIEFRGNVVEVVEVVRGEKGKGIVVRRWL